MSLVSTGFLLFLLAGVIVYYIIPKKMQWVWLDADGALRACGSFENCSLGTERKHKSHPFL